MANYKVKRSISYEPKGKKPVSFQPGDTVTSRDVPESVIKDWLSVEAIQEARNG